jgi:magnesium chelatase subunit H
MLAARVARIVALRRSQRAERKVAMVVFNFPPNAGNIGTAATWACSRASSKRSRACRPGLHHRHAGQRGRLRDACCKATPAATALTPMCTRSSRWPTTCKRERWLPEIEAAWGPAPGRILSDGRSIFVLGAQFGNVLVAVQPGMGYEGDPMRLLFEKGFAPTHAFSAFYRYLREDFKADAVLHFGTHGSLEFMPGKQTGMTGNCWPDRLIADLPNFYLYASNNPSEGAIAKRRAAATSSATSRRRWPKPACTAACWT